MSSNPLIDQIWRHPIKSLGAERVKSLSLQEGKTLPGDRVWALTYENSRFDKANPSWAPSQVFLRCSIAPLFAAVSTKFNNENGTLEFHHPELPKICLDLDNEVERKHFIEWVRPICPKNAPQPIELCKVPGRGMTDTDYPSISLNSIDSLNNLSALMEINLHPRRFRGNIWLSGLKPWAELTWIGCKISIGRVELEVVEPIQRCNTTKTNEKTGLRDADTLSTLQMNFGHKNFGVYCKVISSGRICEGDSVECLKI
ncbi:MAG: molybdenum cofactor biosysynthesis protein [Rhodobacteraceae bacterium]|nr:MAG: molybdenum cofactor biosysynthesis protein [Paracoccaceae bacterium]